MSSALLRRLADARLPSGPLPLAAHLGQTVRWRTDKGRRTRYADFTSLPRHGGHGGKVGDQLDQALEGTFRPATQFRARRHRGPGIYTAGSTPRN